jgi:signal peptidase II
MMSKETLKSPLALSRFVLATVVGLGLDLGVKAYAWQKLLVGYRVDDFTGDTRAVSRVFRFIPGWLHFELTMNRGAVFGLGQGQRWLFLIVSAAAIAFLTYLFALSQKKQWYYQLLLGILLAGVLGNMYDRIIYGYVRDMIHALPGQKWPAALVAHLPGHDWKTADIFPWIFNVADSLLCTGVALMILYSLFFAPRPAASADPVQNAKPQADAGV